MNRIKFDDGTNTHRCTNTKFQLYTQLNDIFERDSHTTNREATATMKTFVEF